MSFLVGVDVGGFSVKVSCIEKKRGKNILVDFFSFRTPYTQKFSLDGKEFVNQLVSFLPARVWERAYVGVNIYFSPVSVLTLDLPKMKKKELNIAVITEAKRRIIPPPEPDTLFEYAISGEIKKDEATHYKILVVRTERNFIDEILHVFEVLEETYPVFISPLCFTLAEFFSPYLSKEKDTAVIDMGFDSIDISILQRGKLSFYRNIKFGLKDITSHFSEVLGLEIEEIERIIKEKGVPQIDVDFSDRVKIAEEIMRQKYGVSKKQEEVNILELRMLWQTEMERIIQEIRRTFVYYRKQEERNVETLIFLGGGSKIKGLIEFLNTQIGGELKKLDSLVDIEVPPAKKEFREELSVFTPSLSLALGIPLNKREIETINFLPLSLKKREHKLIWQIEIVVIGAIFLVFSFLGWVRLSVVNLTLKNKIKKIDEKLKTIPTLLATLSEFKQRNAIIKEKSEAIGRLLRERVDFPSLLKDIASRVPKKIFLLSLKIEKKAGLRVLDTSGEQEIGEEAQNDNSNFSSSSSYSVYVLKIEGGVFSDYEEFIEVVESFKEELERSGYFKRIIINFPPLKKISPVIRKNNFQLTQEEFRRFDLEAEIVR